MEIVYMRSVESLLAEAVEKCHSQSELARQLGIHRQEMSLLVKGERPISPEMVALLGDVLELPGEEVQSLVALAIIGAAKNASKRDRLRKAFFGCWVAGAVATTLLVGAPTEATAKTPNANSGEHLLTFHHIHCRAFLTAALSCLRNLLQGARRRLRAGLVRPFNLHAHCAA